MIHPTVVVEEFSVIRNCSIGPDVHISSCVRIEQHCHIRCKTFIGHGVVMRPYTYISERCKIGHYTVFEGRCAVGSDTIIQAQSNITRGAVIGRKVFIGMMFCGGNDNVILHQRWDTLGEFVPHAYRVENFARIGFRVDVLPGVVIGENSFVAAGSLVTKDVPENARVKGRPAKIYGEVPVEERLCE